MAKLHENIYLGFDFCHLVLAISSILFGLLVWAFIILLSYHPYNLNLLEHERLLINELKQRI